MQLPAKRLQRAAPNRRETDLSVDEPAISQPDPEIVEYYSKKIFEYNFSSMCKMSVPMALEGQRVLDIGCRRGKGVFKLSSRVGNTGHVIGIDWSDDFIAEASQRSERAWRESRLLHNNMEFHVAYPEDLARIGIADDSLDLVFVNSVINLAYDYDRAFAEMFRVLKPGGLLICETVLSNAERDETVMSAAREIGNNVQSAPSKRYFEELLAHLGFGAPDYLDATMVAKDAGFKHTYSAPVVETDEEALFVAAVAYIRKPD